MDFYERFSFSYDEEDCYKSMLFDYGDSTYGKEKLPENILFYIGYITRYICYTRNITSSYFYETFGVDDLIRSYEVFHTQSEEYVINELLNIHHLTEKIFDEDEIIKDLIKEQYKSKKTNHKNRNQQ